MEDKNKIRYWNNHDPNTVPMTDEQIRNMQVQLEEVYQPIIKLPEMTEEQAEKFKADWLAMMEQGHGPIVEVLEEEKYVIQSGFIGNDMSFWQKGRSGYTANFENVHLFTFEEAKKAARKHERIFSYNKLRALTSRVINAEHVKGIWDCEVK